MKSSHLELNGYGSLFSNESFNFVGIFKQITFIEFGTGDNRW